MKKWLAVLLSLITIISMGNFAPIEAKAESQVKYLQEVDYQPYSIFRDGVMLVKNEAGKLGMINGSGELLVNYKYESGMICSGGYVVFERRHVYDNKGKLVYEDKSASIEHCGNGVLLLLETGNWKVEGHDSWTVRKVYKKLDGTVIYSGFGWGDAGEWGWGQFNKQGYAWICEDACPCCLNKDVKIIDLKGNVVNSYGIGETTVESVDGGTVITSPPDVAVIGHQLWTISEDGYVLIDDVVRYGCIAYLDFRKMKPGDLGQRDIFDIPWQGSTYAERVAQNGRDANETIFYGSTDENGNYCFSVNSMAVMALDDNYFLVDVAKNRIVAQYPYIANGASKYILVETEDGKWGYIDKTGKEYKFYEDATVFHNGYAMVKVDGLLYVINEKFEIVSEGIKGDSASALLNNHFNVKNGTKEFVVRFNPNGYSSAPSITTQPKTTYTKKGAIAKVTVKASGDGLKYQWYFKNAGATKYSKSSNTTSVYDTKMSSSSKNRMVYCVVTDKYGKTVQSKTVYLRESVSITTQPKTTYTKKGAIAKVTVKASGDGLKYQWYFKNVGATKYSKSSNTTSVYDTKMSSSSKNRMVYCVVTDKYGNKVKSDTKTLREAVSITTQPKAVTVKKNATAKVSVKASGDGLKYTWYVKDAGKTKYVKSSITKSTYSVKMTAKTKNRLVYCVVTDKYGKTVKTVTVKLKMK